MREKHLSYVRNIKERKRTLPSMSSPSRTKRSALAPLAIHPDKFTYTFIFKNEVLSIHYDRIKSEIFYQGHNIKNLNINKDMQKALEQVLIVLSDDEEGKLFISEYKATLDRHYADNK
jgi:hypothetical protein